MTRSLFEGIQAGSETAQSAWQAADQKYASHYKRIMRLLPGSAREFSKGLLHDAIVREVEIVPSDRITLVLDGSNCMEPFKRGHLVVKGMQSSCVPPEIRGATWLYEEWDTASSDSFELSVLCDVAEFTIVGRHVKLRLNGNVH